MDKIYSRRKISIPKIKYIMLNNQNNKFEENKKIRKTIKTIAILLIALSVANMSIRAIEPIIEVKCISIARSIATKISNEQATKVMADYKYEDLANVTKDEEGNIKMISANVITVNKIISDIPVLIQEEMDKAENSKFYIRLGSFTGSKILAGRGPNVEIKMVSAGNVETDLKSEFTSAGINQTVHRIYLSVKCNVSILTPFSSTTEHIENQVLLAEGVIIGNIPETYYNIEGLTPEQSLELIQ